MQWQRYKKTVQAEKLVACKNCPAVCQGLFNKNMVNSIYMPSLQKEIVDIFWVSLKCMHFVWHCKPSSQTQSNVWFWLHTDIHGLLHVYCDFWGVNGENNELHFSLLLKYWVCAFCAMYFCRRCVDLLLWLQPSCLVVRGCVHVGCVLFWALTREQLWHEVC